MEPAKPKAPKEIKVTAPKGGDDKGGEGGNGKGNGKGNGGGGKGADVAALPSTGAGVAGVADTDGALLLLTVLGAAGAAGYGLRRRVA